MRHTGTVNAIRIGTSDTDIDTLMALLIDTYLYHGFQVLQYFVESYLLSILISSNDLHLKYTTICV